jgi:hypothetical protein
LLLKRIQLITPPTDADELFQIVGQAIQHNAPAPPWMYCALGADYHQRPLLVAHGRPRILLHERPIAPDISGGVAPGHEKHRDRGRCAHSI